MTDRVEQESSVLDVTEIDAIGEIMNISMGSAATAVSTMLDKQVSITTPKVEVQKFHDLSYAKLEPAILVKIEYIEGISGCNVMVFRQSDMQVILNLLMGNEDTPAEDFIFDEMSMSAACEVMNQMMGSSATALSSFLGKTINISTPDAVIMDDANTFESAMGLGQEDNIVSVSFRITITDVMSSEFISVMTCHLARDLVSQLMAVNAPTPEIVPASPAPAPPMERQPPAAVPSSVQTSAVAPSPPAPASPAQQQASPPYPPQPPAGYPPPPPPLAPPYGSGAPPYPPEWGQPNNPAIPPYGYPSPYGYAPYGYAIGPYGYPMTPQPEQGKQPSGIIKQPESVNIQIPQFPNFNGHTTPVFAAPLTGSNMELMMNVPLNVSVEIGKTKKKIREIMDFNQGTVIELEKQAGAPVDIVVNGQLIARGDVVVVEDNFGVRITEIVGTKELMETLENN